MTDTAQQSESNKPVLIVPRYLVSLESGNTHHSW